MRTHRFKVCMWWREQVATHVPSSSAESPSHTRNLEPWAPTRASSAPELQSPPSPALPLLARAGILVPAWGLVPPPVSPACSAWGLAGLLACRRLSEESTKNWSMRKLDWNKSRGEARARWGWVRRGVEMGLPTPVLAHTAPSPGPTSFSIPPGFLRSPFSSCSSQEPLLCLSVPRPASSQPSWSANCLFLTVTPGV